jgi:hypothetical protein
MGLEQIGTREGAAYSGECTRLSFREGSPGADQTLGRVNRTHWPSRFTRCANTSGPAVQVGTTVARLKKNGVGELMKVSARS